MSEEIIAQIDSRLEKKFENYTLLQQRLHEDFHAKMLEGVREQVQQTVNGKIDAIKKQLDNQDVVLKSLDARIQPFEDGIGWFTRAKDGVGWLAGFIAPFAIVCGAILYILDQIRK